MIFPFECSNPVKRYRISADRFTKASGRMESGTDWAWRPVDDGYTGASGRKDSRVDTASGNRPRPRRGTRERGRAVFRMDTVQRPTPTVVSSALILYVYIYIYIFHTFNEERWKFFWIPWRAWAGIYSCDILKLVNGSLSIFIFPRFWFWDFKGLETDECVKVSKDVLK